MSALPTGRKALAAMLEQLRAYNSSVRKYIAQQANGFWIGCPAMFSTDGECHRLRLNSRQETVSKLNRIHVPRKWRQTLESTFVATIVPIEFDRIFLPPRSTQSGPLPARQGLGPGTPSETGSDNCSVCPEQTPRRNSRSVRCGMPSKVRWVMMHPQRHSLGSSDRCQQAKEVPCVH